MGKGSCRVAIFLTALIMPSKMPRPISGATIMPSCALIEIGPFRSNAHLGLRGAASGETRRRTSAYRREVRGPSGLSL